MKIAIRSDRLLTYALNGVCVMLALGGFILGCFEMRFVSECRRDELLWNARLLSETINMQRVALLRPDAAGLDSPSFSRLREQFSAVLADQPTIHSISLINIDEKGEARYLLDVSSSGAARPGDEFPRSTEALHTVFSDRKPRLEGPYQSDGIEYFSAFVPLVIPGEVSVAAILELRTVMQCMLYAVVRGAMVLWGSTALLLLVIFGGRRIASHFRGNLFLVVDFLWVASIGLVLTGIIARGADRYERRVHEGTFSMLSYLESNAVLKELKEMRDGYIEGVGRFFENSDFVDEIEFKNYVGYLLSVPHLDSVLWAPASPCRTVYATDPYLGASSFPVVYKLLPEKSPLSVGIDLRSFEPLEKSMSIAAKEGFSTASEPMPVYDGVCQSVVFRPVADRGGKLSGFIVAVLNWDSLLRKNERKNDVMNLTLSRILPGGEKISILSTGPEEEEATCCDQEMSVFRLARPLLMFGHTFALEVSSGEMFRIIHPRRSGKYVFWSGAAVSILVALLTGAYVNWHRAMVEFVRRKTASLAKSELRSKKLAHLYRSISEGVVILDSKGFVEECNPALEELTGYRFNEMRGNRLSLFAAKEGQFNEEFVANLKKTGRWEGELLNRKKEGEVYPVWLSISTVTDGDGSPSNYTGVFRHIGRIKSEQERLTRMAYHDFLTGLPNRALLMDRLEMALARAKRDHTVTALLFLDLDNFKIINDTFGHETGDALLIEVAERLKEAHREQDTVARLAGDEFVILFEGLHHENELDVILKHLRRLFDESFHPKGQEVRISASIGTSFYPRDGRDGLSLLAVADRAMYAEKSGKKASTPDTSTGLFDNV